DQEGAIWSRREDDRARNARPGQVAADRDGGRKAAEGSLDLRVDTGRDADRHRLRLRRDVEAGPENADLAGAEVRLCGQPRAEEETENREESPSRRPTRRARTLVRRAAREPRRSRHSVMSSKLWLRLYPNVTPAKEIVARANWFPTGRGPRPPGTQ